MKAYYKNIWIALACFLAVWGCSKKPTDYRNFLGGQEVLYPGKIINPNVYPGNLRLMLTWMPSPDPSVNKYVVYWNNNADSTVISALSHTATDTVKCLISNLSEYAYTFFIYSYDNSGNRSIVTEIDNARVYGSIYQNSLFNRQSNTSLVNPDGSLTLTFLPSVDSINVATVIKYTNTGGSVVTASLSPGSSSINLPGFKSGTHVLYQSSFIPKIGAIDTFYTNGYDTFTIMCDKNQFKAMNLPYDMQPYDASQTYLAQLWNGTRTPRDYPNIFHSDGGLSLPSHFSFDMGVVYPNLKTIEEIGRGCCHNPTDFEVWGIADTTGAISTLSGSDPGWMADVQAKGWALLKEVKRADDGVAPVSADFISNPPPVRFIMIRVKQTADNSNYVNLSQVTFWNK